MRLNTYQWIFLVAVGIISLVAFTVGATILIHGAPLLRTSLTQPPPIRVPPPPPPLPTCPDGSPAGDKLALGDNCPAVPIPGAPGQECCDDLDCTFFGGSSSSGSCLPPGTNRCPLPPPSDPNQTSLGILCLPPTTICCGAGTPQATCLEPIYTFGNICCADQTNNNQPYLCPTSTTCDNQGGCIGPLPIPMPLTP